MSLMADDPALQDLNQAIFWKLLLSHEKKYDSELERLISFSVPTPWPHKLPCPRTFARYGFYYTGSKDIVKCHFCKQIASGWMDTDRPEVKHLEFTGICPLQHGYPTDNIPIRDYDDICDNDLLLEEEQKYDQLKEEEEKEDNIAEATVCSNISPLSKHNYFYYHPDQLYNYNYSNASKSRKNRDPNKKEEHLAVILIPTYGGPIRPDFISFEKRLATFSKSKPQAGNEDEKESGGEEEEEKKEDEDLDRDKPSAEAMAEFGLFLNEEGNIVCFHCNLPVPDDEWTRESDLYEEHKKLYPGCLLSILPNPKPNMDKKEDNDEGEQLAQLLEAAVKLEDKEEEAEAPIKMTQDEEAKEEDEEKEKEKAATTSKVEKTKTKTSKKKEDEPSLGKFNLLCKVCNEKNVTIAYVKCGHMVTCDHCVPKVNSCGDCGSPIPYIVRIAEPLKLS